MKDERLEVGGGELADERRTLPWRRFARAAVLGTSLAAIPAAAGCDQIVGIGAWGEEAGESTSSTGVGAGGSTGASTGGAGAGGSTGASTGGAGAMCAADGCSQASAEDAACNAGAVEVVYDAGAFQYDCLRLKDTDSAKFLVGGSGMCKLHDGLPGSAFDPEGPIAKACSSGSDGCDLNTVVPPPTVPLADVPCVLTFYCDPGGVIGHIVVTPDCN